MAKKTYFVKEPLQHDGEVFAMGGEITLDTKLAAGLLESGVISVELPVAAEEAAPVIDAESPAE